MSMIICIGGSSRSGKTMLSKLIKSKIENQNLSVQIIHMDEYVISEDKMPKIKNIIDWEHPQSIDHIKIVDIISHSNNDYIIIEGHLVFAFCQFNSSKNIFIEIDQDEFYSRKKEDTRWGTIEDWYIEHIWNSYLNYGKLYLKLKNTMTVNGTQPWDITSIMNFIDDQKQK